MIRPYNSVMVEVLLKPIVAALQLFALYVLVHGHYSPGGGFQAGVLFACSMILPVLVRGKKNALLVLSLRSATILAAVGVMIYATIGIGSFFFGSTLLDYSVLPLAMEHSVRRSFGILFVEVGVAVAVAGSCVAIFYVLYEDLPQEHAVQPSLGVE